MYCISCGKEIKLDEQFCTSCGVSTLEAKNSTKEKTSFEKRLSEKMNKNDAPSSNAEDKKEKLESKAWFRFLKVCYIFVFLAGLLLIVGVSIATFPSRTVDDDLSAIKCNNGKVYTLSKNNIYAYSYNETLDSSNSEHARILCKYDTLDFYSYKYSKEFIPANYMFAPVYTRPAVGDHILYSILWLVGFVLVIKLIKIAALYIFTGTPRWKNELRRPY